MDTSKGKATLCSGEFQGAEQSPADSEETSSSPEANTWIMGLWRFGNGRIGRKRGEPDSEEPSLFASSSGSGSEGESESESESDKVDDEPLVTLRLPDEEDELEIECDLLAGRCSK